MNSKKVRYALGVVMLGCLLFTVGIPFINSMMIAQGGVSWEFVPHPSYFSPDSYSPYGWLYRTVVEYQRAYDLNPLYEAGYDGSGQTVVIVDAYGSPTIYSDFLAFITWQNEHGANLPWTTMAEVQSHLKIYYPMGKPAFNPLTQGSWALETTLDVDMVHAIAPGADIALVISPNNLVTVMGDAINYAITNHLGSVISQSFGAPEYLFQEPTSDANKKLLAQFHNNYLLAQSYGITVFSADGDAGSTDGGPFNNPDWPASDPYVTAVGGTSLFMRVGGGYKEGAEQWSTRPTSAVGQKYSYEIAGNDYEAMVADGYPTPTDGFVTGGAPSLLFTIPSWQQGITLTYADGTTVQATMRSTSDVSVNGGAYGGLGIVFLSAYGYMQRWVVGGTSAGAPFWAALTAIANQVKGGNIGYINPSLYAFYWSGKAYKSGAFHDITMGDNTESHNSTILGYRATAGWDAPTGIGSPDAAKLVPIMATW